MLAQNRAHISLLGSIKAAWQRLFEVLRKATRQRQEPKNKAPIFRYLSGYRRIVWRQNSTT